MTRLTGEWEACVTAQTVEPTTCEVEKLQSLAGPTSLVRGNHGQTGGGESCEEARVMSAHEWRSADHAYLPETTCGEACQALAPSAVDVPIPSIGVLGCRPCGSAWGLTMPATAKHPQRPPGVAEVVLVDADKDEYMLNPIEYAIDLAELKTAV